MCRLHSSNRLRVRNIQNLPLILFQTLAKNAFLIMSNFIRREVNLGSKGQHKYPGMQSREN
jgi:hypothetical protein